MRFDVGPKPTDPLPLPTLGVTTALEQNAAVPPELLQVPLSCAPGLHRSELSFKEPATGLDLSEMGDACLLCLAPLMHDTKGARSYCSSMFDGAIVTQQQRHSAL